MYHHLTLKPHQSQRQHARGRFRDLVSGGKDRVSVTARHCVSAAPASPAH
jgi:hypothetical protein